MFGLGEIRERLSRLETQVRSLTEARGSVEQRKLKEIPAELERLQRSVSDLTQGNGVDAILREAIGRIDRDELRRRVVAELENDVRASAREALREAIESSDFLSELLEDESLRERIVEVVSAKVGEALPMADLVKEIAENIIENGDIDTSDVASQVAETVSERMEINVTIPSERRT